MNAAHRLIRLSSLGLLLPLVALAAPRPVNETRAAPATGTVQIDNAAGQVQVAGGDGSEVRVTGTLGSDEMRLEITQSGERTLIKVVRPEHFFSWRGNDETRLQVVVPKGSSLETHFASADLVTHGVQGAQSLHSVSGEISGDAVGELKVGTVSGDVQIEARGVRKTSIDTTSGDARLTGAAGEVSVKTVSGNATLDLGALTAAQFDSVSGDLKLTAGLADGGSLDAHSVSGGLKLDFRGALNADVSARSVSGSISQCGAGHDASSDRGHRLEFHSGTGGGKLRLDTTSGDIRLCAGK